MKKISIIFLMILVTVIAGLVIGYTSQDNAKQDQPYTITVEKGKSNGEFDFVVHAWQGNNWKATYWQHKNGTGELTFDHKDFDFIFLQLDKFDKVTRVDLNMQDFYHCLWSHNKEI